jgi:protein-S-isoprenylcysteine O-methyltransferase Ste14
LRAGGGPAAVGGTRAACEDSKGNHEPVRKASAAVGSLVFLVLVPGVVAGLVPWWLTDWDVRRGLLDRLPLRVGGFILVGVGVVVLVQAFVHFVVEGVGTPAPVAPTERLVVGGLYRHVRNPTYLAVSAVIVGQALALAQPLLLLYALAFAVAVAGFVHWYEEPTLRRRYGEEYETYRRAVPAWWPRRAPWQPGAADRH